MPPERGTVESPPHHRAEASVPAAPSVRLRVWLGIALLAALVYAVVIAASDVDLLARLWSDLEARLVLAAVGLIIVGYGFRVLRWQLYVRRLGHEIGPVDAGLTYMAGFAMGITPGKLGEVVKGYYLWQRNRVPGPHAIAAVVADRMTDAIAIALLLGVGLIGAPILGLGAGLLLLAVVALALVALRSRAVGSLIVRLLERTPLVRRIAPHAETTLERARPLLGGRTLRDGTLLGLAAWAVEPIAMWLLAQGMGIELSLAACTVVFTAASLAGVLTFMPGGLGATEGGMVGLLLLLDVPLSPAVALTILMRVLTLWFSVALGALALAVLHSPRRHTFVQWSRPRPPWSWRLDGAVMAVLGLGTVLLRWPLRSRYLNAWDSTSFALALEEFDVLAQRPHAPGYPVYIALARLVHAFVPDANTTLVLTSILFSAGAVALLYGLGRRLASRRTALLAAVLFAFAPIFVFNGLIALSYASEAFASVGLAWLAWRAQGRPTTPRIVALAGAWGLAVGLRQSLLLFLAPLVAWAVLTPPASLRERARRCALTAASALAAALAWFIPMVLATTDGLNGWRRAMRIQGDVVLLRESVFVRGWDAFAEHARRVSFYLDSEIRWLLPVILVCILLVMVRRFRSGGDDRPDYRRAGFAAAWLLPALLFYLTVFSGWDKGPTGYILVVLPGVYLGFALLVDRALEALADGPRVPIRWRTWMRAAATVAVLLLLLPLHSAATPWVEKEVKAHDEWGEAWDDLKAEYPPETTAILTFYSWAHVKWYFPEYVVWGYFPIPRNADPPEWELFLETRDHSDDVLFYEAHERGPGQPEHEVPAGIETVVVFDFQLAGENGGPRRLRPDVNVTEERLESGWRLLAFRTRADRPTIESYFTPLARPEPSIP